MSTIVVGPVELAIVTSADGPAACLVRIHGTRAGTWDYDAGRDCWTATLDPDVSKLGLARLHHGMTLKGLAAVVARAADRAEP